MPKPAAAAVNMQQRLQCLQRLQHLQTQFLHIDSPAELADAEREGGHILALLLHGKHIEPDSLLLNARDILLDYAAGALATRKDNGLPFDDGLAQHYQLSLWGLVAMSGSDHQRVILHDAGPAPTWTVTRTIGTTTDTQKLDTGVRVKTTDRARDYRQQGKRYSLLVSELIAKLGQAVAKPTKANQNQADFTDDELTDALAELLNRAKRYYTQQQVVDALQGMRPGKKIARERIRNHPRWQHHKASFGKGRKPKGTSQQAREARLKAVIDDQERNELADRGARVKGHRIKGTD